MGEKKELEREREKERETLGSSLKHLIFIAGRLHKIVNVF